MLLSLYCNKRKTEGNTGQEKYLLCEIATAKHKTQIQMRSLFSKMNIQCKSQIQDQISCTKFSSPFTEEQ